MLPGDAPRAASDVTTATSQRLSTEILQVSCHFTTVMHLHLHNKHDTLIVSFDVTELNSMWKHEIYCPLQSGQNATQTNVHVFTLASWLWRNSWTRFINGFILVKWGTCKKKKHKLPCVLYSFRTRVYTSLKYIKYTHTQLKPPAVTACRHDV